jgi:hypothetical protein
MVLNFGYDRCVKSMLRAFAAILLLGAIGFWLAMGANRGWTKTSVPKKIVDEITGIEGQTYENKFVPGVDFLAAVAALSLVLAGASFLFRTKSSPNQSNTQSSDNPT